MKMQHNGITVELNSEEAFEKLSNEGAVLIEDLEVIANTILLCYKRGLPIRMDSTWHKGSWLGQRGTRVFKIRLDPDA